MELDFYTNISDQAQDAIKPLNQKQLHYLIVSLVNELVKRNGGENPRVDSKILNEILTMSDFDSYSLMIYLCDRCKNNFTTV